METEKKFSITQIAVIGVMTAVICILAPFSLPIGPVPISFTNLAIYIALYVLGMKRGTISYLIYLLIGLVGVPVFSGFTGEPQKLFGTDRRISDRIYPDGSDRRHCDRQVHEKMVFLPACDDRRNLGMLSVWNRMAGIPGKYDI